MTDRIKKEIERLLEEPGEGGQASNRVRSRLVATLSEGLGEAVPGASGTDIATMAAFLDGKLSESERERFASDLARQPALRADLESAASLVEETSTGKLTVPKHLMAQASAQFAPTPAPQRQVQRDTSSSWLAMLMPRQRLAWALVAALVVIVAVPASRMIRDQSGGGEQPELSGVTEPETPQSQRDKACEDSKKEKAKAQKAGQPLPDTPAKDDPCDPAGLKKSDGKK